MPTYAYRCEACEHEFERFQSITANAIRKCPECGKLKVRRLIGSGAGILFKGGGFYETDYRSDSYKDAAKKEKSSTEKKDGASKDKTTAKSDASKSTKSKSASDSKKSA